MKLQHISTQKVYNAITLIALGLLVFTLLFLSGCSTQKDMTVSYTPIFKENKALKQTILLDRKGLIWVMNFEKHCINMSPNITVSFAKEVPYKRFVLSKYEVSEVRGYNCDGDFALLIPLDSPLITLLRTQYLRSIDIQTAGGGKVVVSVTKNSEAILKAIQALNWKTPIPILPEEDNTRQPLGNALQQ